MVKIYFMDGAVEEYPLDRIMQTEPGITILEEDRVDVGTFHPFHRIKMVVLSDD